MSTPAASSASAIASGDSPSSKRHPMCPRHRPAWYSAGRGVHGVIVGAAEHEERLRSFLYTSTCRQGGSIRACHALAWPSVGNAHIRKFAHGLPEVAVDVGCTVTHYGPRPPRKACGARRHSPWKCRCAGILWPPSPGTSRHRTRPDQRRISPVRRQAREADGASAPGSRRSTGERKPRQSGPLTARKTIASCSAVMASRNLLGTGPSPPHCESSLSTLLALSLTSTRSVEPWSRSKGRGGEGPAEPLGHRYAPRR